MAEKPIIFNSNMVAAIMDGRKTQTRRVMKKQPVLDNNIWWYGDEPFIGDDVMIDHLFQNVVYGNGGSPYGSVYADGTADRMWVRENFQAQSLAGKWWSEVPRDDREWQNWAWTNPVRPAYEATPPRWLPSIHMPKNACRIYLDITDVRVERVQDMSKADAIAEGIDQLSVEQAGSNWELPDGSWTREPLVAFASLWDSINAKRGFSWESNPFVWVVEFKQFPA